MDEGCSRYPVYTIYCGGRDFWHHLGAFIGNPKKVTKTYLEAVTVVVCQRLMATIAFIGKI